MKRLESSFNARNRARNGSVAGSHRSGSGDWSMCVSGTVILHIYVIVLELVKSCWPPVTEITNISERALNCYLKYIFLRCAYACSRTFLEVHIENSIMICGTHNRPIEGMYLDGRNLIYICRIYDVVTICTYVHACYGILQKSKTVVMPLPFFNLWWSPVNLVSLKCSAPPPPPGGRGGAPTPSRFRYKKTSIYPSKYSGNTGYRYNAVCLRGLRHLAARDSIGRLFHSISLSIINLCMYNILKSLREAGKDIEYSSVSRTLYFPKNHGQENIGCSSLARYGSSFCFCILLTIVEIWVRRY